MEKQSCTFKGGMIMCLSFLHLFTVAEPVAHVCVEAHIAISLRQAQGAATSTQEMVELSRILFNKPIFTIGFACDYSYITASRSLSLPRKPVSKRKSDKKLISFIPKEFRFAKNLAILFLSITSQNV